MTQNGGIDVLIAWCVFGVLLVLLGWLVFRHHDDPVERALRSDDDMTWAQDPSDDESNSSN